MRSAILQIVGAGHPIPVSVSAWPERLCGHVAGLCDWGQEVHGYLLCPQPSLDCRDDECTSFPTGATVRAPACQGPVGTVRLHHSKVSRESWPYPRTPCTPETGRRVAEERSSTRAIMCTQASAGRATLSSFLQRSLSGSPRAANPIQEPSWWSDIRSVCLLGESEAW